MYMAPATEVARKNNIPTAPPNSGPNDRLIMKYEPPAGTIPLVAMADNEMAVVNVTEQQMNTMMKAAGMPAVPTNQTIRMNRITPKMFCRHGK